MERRAQVGWRQSPGHGPYREMRGRWQWKLQRSHHLNFPEKYCFRIRGTSCGASLGLQPQGLNGVEGMGGRTATARETNVPESRVKS